MLLGYIIRRVLLTVPVLLGVAVIVFIGIRLVPGDPATIFAGERATEEMIEALRSHLGLDQPLHVQLLIFLANLIRGDLGNSIRSGLPVTEEVGYRFVNTIQLALAATVVSIFLGVPMGILCAVKRRTAIDRLGSVAAALGVSAPAFWIGIILQVIFAVRLGLLPTAGMDTPAHLILPAVTLGCFPLATVAKQMRASLIDILGQDYIRTARAKGLAEQAVIFGHAVKNAMIPTVTIIGLQFGFMLGGAVLTEVVFAWPGLGRYLVQSIFNRDYPAVQGAVLIISVSYVFINLATDLVYAYIDPRIRYG